MALLDIRNLAVAFATRGGAFRAVSGFDLSVDANEAVAIVGESGSGKSVAMLALMGLLPPSATVTADQIHFAGIDMKAMSRAERRRLIGKDLAMIFQEPTSSLNPCFTIGFQIAEALRRGEDTGGKARQARVVELLAQVGIPDPAARARAFPHQLSGGMNQRAMIAMALAGRPKLLIADEPTTALDVTIQAQILDLLVGLRRETGMALILITHDMGVVAETAERVVVQYASEQVEAADTVSLFADPHHPYTAALLAALPERATGARLAAIPGMVPGQFDRPDGCAFSPRCAFATALCRATAPPRAGSDFGRALCHTPLSHGTPTAKLAEAAR